MWCPHSRAFRLSRSQQVSYPSDLAVIPGNAVRDDLPSRSAGILRLSAPPRPSAPAVARSHSAPRGSTTGTSALFFSQRLEREFLPAVRPNLPPVLLSLRDAGLGRPDRSVVVS